MSKKTATSPFQALEEDAYHAFREWPVWLVLRARELEAHLTAHRPPVASNPDTKPEQPRRHPLLDERGQ